MSDGQEITWGEVVESDEIYSAKTGRWYEVIEVRARGARVAIRAVNLPKVIEPLATDKVTVRRGATGEAVDMMISILYSGPR